MPPSTKPKVVVTGHLPAAHLAPLDRTAELIMPAKGRRAFNKEGVLSHRERLAAVINSGELKVNEALLAELPALKIVANMAAGFNNLDLPAMEQRGVWATNTPDAFTDATADLAMGLLLDVARRISEGDRYVRSGRWAEDGFRPAEWDGLRLRGKSIGIVGFGRIGEAVGRRAEAFGMDVFQYGRSTRGRPGFLPLDQLVAECDVVTVHVLLSPGTKHLVDRRRIAGVSCARPRRGPSGRHRRRAGGGRPHGRPDQLCHHRLAWPGRRVGP